MQVDGARYDIGGRTVVVDDDRQLHHVGPFEFHGIHETDDVALLAGCRRQVEDETRIDAFQHIHTQVGLEVVALVDNDYRIQIRQHLNQSRFVRSLHALGHRVVEFGIIRQILVFAIDTPSVFVVRRERLHAQYENRQLFADFRRTDAVPEQCRLLIDHAYCVPEMAVYLLPVGMRRVVQVLVSLFQNRVGGDEPCHDFRFLRRLLLENRPQRIAGYEGLSSGGRNLYRHVGHARHAIVVRTQVGVVERCQRHAFVAPEVVERHVQPPVFLQPFDEQPEVGDYFTLILFGVP